MDNLADVVVSGCALAGCFPFLMRVFPVRLIRSILSQPTRYYMFPDMEPSETESPRSKATARAKPEVRTRPPELTSYVPQKKSIWDSINDIFLLEYRRSMIRGMAGGIAYGAFTGGLAWSSHRRSRWCSKWAHIVQIRLTQRCWYWAQSLWEGYRGAVGSAVARNGAVRPAILAGAASEVANFGFDQMGTQQQLVASLVIGAGLEANVEASFGSAARGGIGGIAAVVATHVADGIMDKVCD